jgi:hypothetical protein
VWLVYYPSTAAGLAECYIKGLPYLGTMLVGDAVFVTLLFGLHHLAQKFTEGGHARITT